MNNAETSYIAPYAYYILWNKSFLFFWKKYLSQENIEKELYMTEENKNYYIRNKIYIQFSLIKNTEYYLNKEINEIKNIDLIKKAKSKLISFKKQLGTDIIMLNSFHLLKKTIIEYSINKLFIIILLLNFFLLIY